MKKTYTLIAGVLLVLAAKAQSPTYSSTDWPKLGTSMSTQYADTAGFAVGSSGASQTWTMTISPISGSAVTTFFLTPAAGPDYSSFPTSTVVASLNGDYEYYKISTNQAAILGASSPAGVVNYNTNPEVYMPLPLSYQTTLNTTPFSGSTTTGFTVTGNTSGMADAYGTLIVNGHTFNNVLRYKLTSVTIDSIASTGGIHNTSVIYAWYQAGKPQPLLSYTTNVIAEYPGGSPSKTPSSLAFDRDAIPTGINEIEPIHVRSLAPNPCNNQATLSVDINNAKETTISVFDAAGRLVSTNNYSGLSNGINNFDINTSALSAGVYIIMATGNNGSYPLCKFVKQ